MEYNETSVPWSNPSLLQDFLFKEIYPKLRRDDIFKASICKVNKAWREIFTKNAFWKSALEREMPFVDISSTKEYYKKFCDVMKSCGSKYKQKHSSCADY